MVILAAIQARMCSKRLYGKIMRKINGKALFDYLIEDLSNSLNICDILFLTSTENSDDVLASYCKKINIKCYRGSLLDVSGRYIAALQQYPCDAFVRICGDSPLLDYRLIDKGINIFKQGNYDIVTNVAERTYPSGQSIEIVKTDVFMHAYSKMSSPEDFEHVTHYFYNNQDQYKLFNFKSDIDYSTIKLSVDTMDDFNLINSIICLMDKPHYNYSYLELVELYRKALANDRSIP